MRLIDADALIIDLMDRGIEWIQTEDWSEIQQTVMEQPTIEERKKGKWEYGVICSICGERCDYHLSGDTWIDELANFCPNCGADMRKEINIPDLRIKVK